MENYNWRNDDVGVTTRQALCIACLLVAFAGSCTPGNNVPCGPSSPPSPKMLQSSATAPATPPGVPGFAEVSDTLYRGAQPTAEGFAELKKMGIKTVVSLRYLGSDQDSLKGLGLQHVQIHCNPFHPEEEDVVAFLKVVTEPGNQPVFVHCRQGIDRTGMMVAIYRVIIQDWAREKAIAEMKAMGFNEAWEGIERYVHSFDAGKIKQRLSSAKPVGVEVIP